MKPDTIIINETKIWLETVVIKFNFCPFAKHELISNRIRFKACRSDNMEPVLETIIQECDYLDSNDDTETTLLILPDAFENFDDYLILLGLANTLLKDQHYEGTYQLASFHPDYCFEGSNINDPANYTNRSPYPMLHILRETSLEAALKHYKQPELIPENNINVARKAGIRELQSILKNCYQNK